MYKDISYDNGFPGSPARISGSVNRFSGAGLEPVSALPVCVINYNSGFWAGSAQTQATGSSEIENLPAGRYIVKAVADNSEFLSQYFSDAFDQSAAEIIDIAGGETRAGIDFVLKQGTFIGGKLIYYSGNEPDSKPIVYVEDSETNLYTRERQN